MLKNKKTLYASIIIAISLLCYILEFGGQNNTNKEHESKGFLQVTFLDVGQGDSTLIKTPNGKFMMIDAGTDEAKNVILDHLSTNNVKEIEYFVLTHPHEDHIGSADDVLNNFKVNNVIMTDKYATTAVFENLLDDILNSKERNNTKIIKPSVDDQFILEDSIGFKILSADGENEDTNNSSIALKLTYDNTSFIFTGDAEKEIESNILSSNADVHANVFHCGHHGSSTSNSKSFLNAILPEIAIISCGKGNNYGHPHNEVLSSLDKLGVKVYRTDIDGNIVLISDGRYVKVHNTSKAA